MAKFTEDDLRDALTELSILEFWRTDPEFKAGVRIFLAKLCESRESLQWLTGQLVDRVGKWPGSAEVRGIYCTRFRPADGLEAFSTIGPYSAEANEGREAEAHAERKRIEAQPLRMIAGDVAADPNAPFAAARERQKSWNKTAVSRENIERAGRTMRHLGFEKRV